ncbi:hypothetical protein [Streptomyces scabiei]|uniref:hypothetical protein n=1 Tax=Streptomyces scabiei TaxID=1930 RepID=UPI0029AD34FF|nr:hypothetical protein [Streptomyces scabiei]MDX3523607.1 hypothetical protein [Streptomyces scabiei]
MPRRRPGRIRAGIPDRQQSQQSRPSIDRLSPRVLSEIVRLERTRNYLQPGDTSAALRLWKDYVHRSERELWHDDEFGDVHWYCCGNPLEGRALLDGVIRAMSPRAARELRKIIDRLDAFLGPSHLVADRRR